MDSLETGAVLEESPPWMPLKLFPSLANTSEDIDRNIDYALRQKAIPFSAILGSESGTVSIVGSGPSLKRNWRALKRLDGDIIACNAATQFLLARGICPKYWFCFDADPLMLEFITADPRITYLLASRCPPKAWELLAGQKIVKWHAAGDLNLQAILERNALMEPMVIGGGAAVTRAMIVAIAMGYRSVHLWGADSSFDGADTHIRKSTTEERHLMVNCGAKVFETAPWMAQQAEEFKALAPHFQSGNVKLVVHGTGLIPHIARIMGFEVDGNQIPHRLRELKYLANQVWQRL